MDAVKLKTAANAAARIRSGLAYPRGWQGPNRGDKAYCTPIGGDILDVAAVTPQSDLTKLLGKAIEPAKVERCVTVPCDAMYELLEQYEATLSPPAAESAQSDETGTPALPTDPA
jgi:hypothetical protein